MVKRVLMAALVCAAPVSRSSAQDAKVSVDMMGIGGMAALTGSLLKHFDWREQSGFMVSGRDSITLPQRADKQRRKSTRQRQWSKSRKHALSARRRYWPTPCGPLILTSTRDRGPVVPKARSARRRNRRGHHR